MNIQSIIIGAVIGAIIGYIVARMTARKKEKTPKQKILEHLRKEGKIANNDVERIAEVSDSTATRYLQQLEDEGKIRQVGKTGKHTYYEKI